ncbi:MAG: hypothetical protein K0R90_1276, partial [Oscillospiraceae bacterium]|nr:hypothetical protein [Oscillospiraceae bacterium]
MFKKAKRLLKDDRGNGTLAFTPIIVIIVMMFISIFIY